MYIDQLTIYFNNGQQFSMKTLGYLCLKRNLGKIEKIFFT